MNDKRPEEAWHLDKRVPIALLFAILLQTGMGVWWGARIDARVAALEQTDVTRATTSERLARVETVLASIDRRLERMEDRK